MIKKKSRTYQACPICENESFTEWSRQVTYQEDVRVDADGNSDYEQADVNEFSDEYEVIEWVCQNCGVSLRLSKNGKLQAVPEN